MTDMISLADYYYKLLGDDESQQGMTAESKFAFLLSKQPELVAMRRPDIEFMRMDSITQSYDILDKQEYNRIKTLKVILASKKDYKL